jgi:cytidylate kinase
MPLVAMTREMGSLGKDVAAALSARLGKPLVHHEIIDHLANKMRLRKSHVIRFLDGKANMWERLTTDKTSMAIYTADETLALAESDGVAVIRGWGSAHLLRPIRHVICVRVCAPLSVRVRRMMERLNTEDEEFITNEIKLSEEAHAAITRRHFGVNWQDSEQYDMVLNTERVAVEECTDEVMALINQPQFRETDESRRMLKNLALESHVRVALRADARTATMQITVEVDDGTVTLAGIVDRGVEPVHAAEVAASVPGVTDIRNRLKVATTSRVKVDH